MSDDRASKALNAAVEGLMQYFDTVQILVTKNKTDDVTIGQSIGKGSLFARVGQVELWLSKVQESLMNDEQEEPNEPEDEAGKDD